MQVFYCFDFLFFFKFFLKFFFFFLAVSELAMTALHGYNGYTLFAWMYGYCLGGFQYALPILVLERLRAKNFARAWSFVEGIRFLPVLLGVPIAGK